MTLTDLFSADRLSDLGRLLAYDPASPLLFNTGLFMALFVAFMAVYELLRGRPVLRMAVTIIFSLYFYYKSSADCVYILLGICVSDYLLGLLLGLRAPDPVRRAIVALNLTVNLGMLVYFKYFNMLLQGWASLSGASFDAWNIILPAGISFITFRSISYIVDLYRRRMEPERNFFDYLFFLTFFPPLLAGPVVRAADMLPQVKARPEATPQMVGEGLFLIMCGLVKKVIVADYLSGNFVSRIFDNPALYSGFENAMGCIGFTIQIYCDFSGYSDMAIGIALLMGFRFKENFNAPFKSQNPSEFWRRWHISLSTWLRDYLYIPLGGSRRGKGRTYFNNFITMVLGGLWHGASWMYVLWGAYQGGLLAAHKALKGRWKLPPALVGTAPVRAANIAVTFILTVIGFTIFRADSPATLAAIAGQIAGDFHLSVAPQFVESYAMIVIAMAAALIVHHTPRSWTTGLTTVYASAPVAAQGVVLALVLFFCIQAAQSDLVPFIYLQY